MSAQFPHATTTFSNRTTGLCEVKGLYLQGAKNLLQTKLATRREQWTVKETTLGVVSYILPGEPEKKFPLQKIHSTKVLPRFE